MSAQPCRPDISYQLRGNSGRIGTTELYLRGVVIMWQNRMSGGTILLRAVQGHWEGWMCMDVREFLQRIDLNNWNVHDRLVGMVLTGGSKQNNRTIGCAPN
jgi:hypothetical protein